MSSLIIRPRGAHATVAAGALGLKHDDASREIDYLIVPVLCILVARFDCPLHLHFKSVIACQNNGNATPDNPVSRLLDSRIEPSETHRPRIVELQSS